MFRTLLSPLLIVLIAGPLHRVDFDRTDLPDLESYLPFEPPTIGAICGDRGEVLIELAREYRRVVSYDDVPLVLREAIPAAEDKNLFSHSDVECRSVPRVLVKTAEHSSSADGPHESWRLPWVLERRTTFLEDRRGSPVAVTRQRDAPASSSSRRSSSSPGASISSSSPGSVDSARSLRSWGGFLAGWLCLAGAAWRG